MVHSEKDEEHGEISTGKILVESKDVAKEYEETIKGGPVDALYKTLHKAIADIYSTIASIQLLNYKVRIFEEKGVESSVRVFIEFVNGEQQWGCVGVSTNILEASFEAIEKGFKYYLSKE